MENIDIENTFSIYKNEFEVFPLEKKIHLKLNLINRNGIFKQYDELKMHHVFLFVTLKFLERDFKYDKILIGNHIEAIIYESVELIGFP